MPELAEVEYGRKVAEQVALGRTIIDVWVDDDTIVFDGVAPLDLAAALVGRRVERVCRRGKHLWFQLDARPWPTFHFGMTGAFHTPGMKVLQLEASPAGGERPWPPRFQKIRMTFDDGGELAMTNKRRLGRIRLRQDPRTEAPIAALGFDPALDLPGEAEFVRMVKRRKTVLKGLLLNQAFAAGVGNWLADEICFQARIDPRRRASELADEEILRLRDALKDIVGIAISVDADKTRFPEGWLFHRRWGRPEGAVTVDGDAIEICTVAGRSTAWVPAVQR